jgi:hypothetical protein
MVLNLFLIDPGSRIRIGLATLGVVPRGVGGIRGGASEERVAKPRQGRVGIMSKFVS